MRRDYDALFGGLPERTWLLRQLRQYQALTDALLGEPSVLCMADTYPIELLLPIRQGRSPAQLGGKNRDKGRWSVGVKLAWVINSLGDDLLLMLDESAAFPYYDEVSIKATDAR